MNSLNVLFKRVLFLCMVATSCAHAMDDDGQPPAQLFRHNIWTGGAAHNARMNMLVPSFRRQEIRIVPGLVRIPDKIAAMNQQSWETTMSQVAEQKGLAVGLCGFEPKMERNIETILAPTKKQLKEEAEGIVSFVGFAAAGAIYRRLVMAEMISRYGKK